jgi:hypothetical protein
VPAGAEDGEAEWPDDADESAFLSDAAARGESQVPVGDRSGAPTLDARLPPLDELVKRVPADVRRVLDELFRAKFTRVRKYAATAGTEAPP